MGDLRMPDINKLSLAGRLTRDPELTYTAGGHALCKFGLAVSRKFKVGGETKEETLFVDVTCWRKTAEYIGVHCKKGYEVLVDGRLVMDTWKDNATGDNRSKLCVTGDRIQQLTWDNNNASPDGGSQSKSYSEAPKPRPIEEPIPEDDIPF